MNAVKKDRMSFDERDQIIVIIISSIVGFLFITLIICLLIWLLIRLYRSRAKDQHSNEDSHSPSLSPYRRQQYQPRSQKFPSNRLSVNNNRKRKRRRFNTNDSVLTLSFDPPHLINQNVKNLDKLLHSESSLTTNSWHYEESMPTPNCYYTTSSNEPVYTSSSTVLTSISNLARMPHTSSHFLNELDHVLRQKRPLNYSQSCRQTNDLLPFDYYRSVSSPSTITGTNSSNQNSLEPIYVRPNKPSNATLIRKARIAQLRDDTAILY